MPSRVPGSAQHGLAPRQPDLWSCDPDTVCASIGFLCEQGERREPRAWGESHAWMTRGRPASVGWAAASASRSSLRSNLRSAASRWAYSAAGSEGRVERSAVSRWRGCMQTAAPGAAPSRGAGGAERASHCVGACSQGLEPSRDARSRPDTSGSSAAPAAPAEQHAWVKRGRCIRGAE